MNLSDASELDLFAGISGYRKEDIARVAQKLGIDERYIMQSSAHGRIIVELAKEDAKAVSHD